MRISMPAVVLALGLASAASTDVLAQVTGPQSGGAKAPAVDGPLFAPPAPPRASLAPAGSIPAASPPVINLPDVGGPPAAPSAASPNQKQPSRLFRRVGQASAAGATPANPTPSKRLLPGKWNNRSPQPTDAPAFAPAANPDSRNLPSAPPAAPQTQPKRLLTPRKYGPVELFPTPRDSDRTSTGGTGNPLVVRRPVLAW
jgi:hypothetical protein